MTRNLKALGLVLFAVFAFSATMASAASADTFTSNSPSGNTDLTGAGAETFSSQLTRGAQAITCENVTYTGTQEGNEAPEVTAHPVYSGPCEPAATVNTNGCDYILSGQTDENGDAKVSIECTPEHSITVNLTSLGIVLHIPEQEPEGGVHYTTLPTGAGPDGEVTIVATASGIESTCTGSAFVCALAGGATNTNGEYIDHVIVEGYEDTGSFLQNPETHVFEGTHGPQVDIGVREE